MLGEELTIIKLNTTEIRSSLWLKGRKEAVTPASIRVMKEHSGTLRQRAKGFECSSKERGSH